MTLPDLVSTLIAVTALLFTVYQFRVSERKLLRQTTFEQIRVVSGLMQAATRHDWDEASTNCVAFYRGETASQSEGARDLMNFLGALDLVALEIGEGQLEARLVTLYFSSAIHPIAEPLRAFIRDLRACYGDDTVFRHIYDLIPRFVPSTAGR